MGVHSYYALPRRTRTDSIAAKPFKEAETAPPEVITQIRPGVERIDRLGWKSGPKGVPIFGRRR
jgi:hypothetical protein